MARFCHTAAVAFHDRSYLTATALLDVTALWAVWRTHKEAHAEAVAAAAVRRAAEDPANRHAQRAALAAQELPLLQCAAAHSKAAYGAPAAAGLVSSASGYLQLITVGQVT